METISNKICKNYMKSIFSHSQQSIQETKEEEEEEDKEEVKSKKITTGSIVNPHDGDDGSYSDLELEEEDYEAPIPQPQMKMKHSYSTVSRMNTKTLNSLSANEKELSSKMTRFLKETPWYRKKFDNKITTQENDMTDMEYSLLDGKKRDSVVEMRTRNELG